MSVFSPRSAYLNRVILSEKFKDIKELIDSSGDENCKDCSHGKISIVIYNFIISKIENGDIKATDTVVGCFGSDMKYIVGGVVYSGEELTEGAFHTSDRDMPGIATSIINFIKSFTIIFYKLFTKNEFFADKKVIKDRINTCLKCDDYCPDTEKCKICTCPVRRKAKFKHSSCPRDEWED
jgi:hypothetical protein